MAAGGVARGALPAPMPRERYARDAVTLARALVGARIVCVGKKVQIARIVETEAYCGPGDAACHARAGLTKRTRSLLGPAGHAYVFLVYGMHECFNVVALREGQGHAVLVRAVEPVAGVDASRTDGPGRVTKALGISRADDALDLCAGERIWIAARERRPRVGVSARVGVGYAGEVAEAPWRFFDEASPCVSRPPRKSIGLGRG
ncbi:MAG: DNA-3-methyladenine glycosylase [Polyangiaceae bacterium]